MKGTKVDKVAIDSPLWLKIQDTETRCACAPGLINELCQRHMTSYLLLARRGAAGYPAGCSCSAGRGGEYYAACTFLGSYNCS